MVRERRQTQKVPRNRQYKHGKAFWEKYTSKVIAEIQAGWVRAAQGQSHPRSLQGSLSTCPR